MANLLRWARGLGVRALLVLGGADAMVRLDSQMSGCVPALPRRMRGGFRPPPRRRPAVRAADFPLLLPRISGPAVHHVATPGAAAAGLRLDAGLPSLAEAVAQAEARLPAHRNPFTAAVATGAGGTQGGAQGEGSGVAAPAGPPAACLAVMQSSGMATALLHEQWGAEEGPPVAALVRHCFEGVNESDGAVLASAAVHALGLALGEGATLKSPPSWAAPSPDAALDATLFT